MHFAEGAMHAQSELCPALRHAAADLTARMVIAGLLHAETTFVTLAKPAWTAQQPTWLCSCITVLLMVVVTFEAAVMALVAAALKAIVAVGVCK